MLLFVLWRVHRLLLLCLLLQVLSVLHTVAAIEPFHLRHGENALSGLHGDWKEHTSNKPVDEFPPLESVVEMANLSQAVYKYRNFEGDDVCEQWNNDTTTATVMRQDGTTCHWYHHEKSLGTQVMIVSSTIKDYLAVVFAGTDDLMTSLLDVDIRKVAFGTQDLDRNKKKSMNASKIPVALDCPSCKVHEGFNSAVFADGIFDEIYVRVEALRPQFSRLFTSGHSLGAASSILTAVGLAVEFEAKHIPLKHPIASINFGCPQIGNVEFRDYINQRFLSHSTTTQNSPYLVIWRYVMGWDLVPRLPEFFEHVGHTIQMHHSECDGIQILPPCSYSKWMHHHQQQQQQQQQDTNKTKEALGYYHHVGNASLHCAGVPSGWSATPYLWVPGALLSHEMARYSAFFCEWHAESQQTWIRDFVTLPGGGSKSNRSDQALINDDTYNEPPDDDAVQLLRS
jgi:Lipase (class 3)